MNIVQQRLPFFSRATVWLATSFIPLFRSFWFTHTVILYQNELFPWNQALELLQAAPKEGWRQCWLRYKCTYWIRFSNDWTALMHDTQCEQIHQTALVTSVFRRSNNSHFCNSSFTMVLTKMTYLVCFFPHKPVVFAADLSLVIWIPVQPWRANLHVLSHRSNSLPFQSQSVSLSFLSGSPIED